MKWNQTVTPGRALLLLLSRFSRVRLCVTPETAAHQAPLSLGFSRQGYWSGLPLPSPPLALGNRKSTFCLYRFAYSKHLIWMSSYNMLFFLTGFFPPLSIMFSRFIYIVAGISASFFCCWQIIPFIDIPHFIYASVDGDLSEKIMWIENSNLAHV